MIVLAPEVEDSHHHKSLPLGYGLDQLYIGRLFNFDEDIIGLC
jgi:hypothetical protein